MSSKTPPTQSKGKTTIPSVNEAQPLPDGYGRVREIMSNLGDSAWSHDFRTGTTWYSSQYNPFVGFLPADLMLPRQKISGGKAPIQMIDICSKRVILPTRT